MFSKASEKPRISNKKETITKDVLIGDIIKKHPELIETLLEEGMHCIGCHVASWETLEQAAEKHLIDINKLIKKLNC